MIKFKETTIDLGEIEKGSKVDVVFPFEGDASEIVKVQPSCSCTADCKVEDAAVVALFTESEKTTANMKDLYPSGFFPISKMITVYLKDDQDLQITGPTGLVYNPHKKSEVLRFNARVRI